MPCLPPRDPSAYDPSLDPNCLFFFFWLLLCIAFRVDVFYNLKKCSTIYKIAGASKQLANEARNELAISWLITRASVDRVTSII